MTITTHRPVRVTPEEIARRVAVAEAASALAGAEISPEVEELMHAVAAEEISGDEAVAKLKARMRRR
ncbi:MAG: hypothetical protein ABI130_14495 [Leifsonia sp.]